MASETMNHDLLIATAKTPHKVLSDGPSDIILDPQMKPIPGTNWDDLKKTTVIQRSSVAAPEGAGSRETVTETEVRTGSLEEAWVGSLDGDAVFQLGDYPLSARGYVRAGLGGPDSLREHRFGIDAAVFKKGQDMLLDRLLSVFFEVTDPAADDKEQSWTLGLAVNVRFNLIQ